MMFNIFKIPVPVSWNGGEGNSSGVARSEREVKEQQACRQHITKTKITQARRNEKENHPFTLCGSYVFIRKLKQRPGVTVLHSFLNYSKSLYLQNVFYLSWGPFPESSETFRVTFSLYLQNEGVSRHETLQFFNFYPLYNIWEDQLYRISGS